MGWALVVRDYNTRGHVLTLLGLGNPFSLMYEQQEIVLLYLSASVV